jgi:WD40 repeat protein
VTVGVGGAAVILPGFDLVAVETALRVNRTPRWVSPQATPPGMRDVAFSPDGREVWTGTAKTFARWTPGGGITGPPPFYPRRGNEGLVALFSHDRTAIVTLRTEKDEGLIVRDLPEGERRVSIPARVGDFRSLAVAPAAAWVTTIDPRPNNRTVRVWDGHTGAERFVLETEEAANCVAASPDGKALAIGVADTGRGPHNKVVFYDPATGLRLFALPTQRRGVMALAFSPDARYLAVGFGGLVQVWDVRTRELVRSITGFERAAHRLAFSPDGERVAAATPDGQVWVWNALSGRLAHRIEVGSRGLRAIAFSPDGRSLATAPNNSPVAVWDLTDPEP